MAIDHKTGKNDPGTLAGEAARSLFSKFRALLEANTAALTTMAAMERMLGGEYIFDRAFLEKSAREVTDFAHQAVYAVNAMTDNHYVALYDRFMAIAATVEDILAGRPGTDDDRLIRPLARLRLEDRPKVGQEGAALGELAGQLGLFVPQGFVVTLEAWSDGRLTGQAREAVATALAHREDGPNASAVTVSVVMFGTTGEAVRQEARGVPAKAEAVLAALDGVSQAALAELADTVGEIHASALVAAAPAAVMRGQIRTYWREAKEPAFLRLDVWPDDDPATRDTLFLERSHPFAARRSIISPKSLDRRLPDGAASLEASPSGFLRGSSLLPFEVAATLAGQAMAAERLLGAPTQLGFCLEASGQAVFESVRPLPQALIAETVPSPNEVLLSGGEAACLGTASGVVVPVDETTLTANFPFGAIAVARSASPALAPLLRRAGAMVAEVGDAAGHLAAVAREYRVPALFGLPGALAALPKGLVVTVDAEAGVVSRGATGNRPAAESGLSPDDPEYLTLRRLLRRIATLTLTDPDAPEFSVDGCRTLHDILHFAHDRAVAVLADLRQAGVSDHLASPLPLPVPLDLRVLDIGGGLVPGTSGLAAVRSRPLAALLSGMLDPGMWDTTPAKVGLGDILGGMEATMAALSGRDAASGGNLAIAARSYCNVSLRLGYHFTVIDAYLGQNPEKNTIYFRFVGGMATAAGRAARAVFLRRVLERYDFKVTTAGDLVVARLKLIEPETAEAALRLLGRLCAFARQRDTGHPDAAALEAVFFSIASGGEVSPGEAP
jgi:pyruvate, water dikinase